ncbi:MAG: UDP-N-acetylmuramoyl-tripeptide--D-alanyl-D-alanine ligase [Phycisphaeraceae bacterium]
MSFWTLQHIQQVTAGRRLVEPTDPGTKLTGVSIDSRTIKPGQVFIAIRGERFDGHDFVDKAIDAGAALLIVSNEEKASSPKPQASVPPVLLVNDTIAALQQLTCGYRDVLRDAGTRVIAVTGSNGKTTTRHLIHTVLSARFNCTQSPGSFNNHLGVPLTLLAASTDDDFVVAEVGSSHPGELAQLADILRPDVAVITNIGTAHIGNFGSRQAIVAEKGSLLRFVEPRGVAVLPGDATHTDLLKPYVDQLPDGACVLWFGGDGDDVPTDRLPLLGEHNRTNAQAAVAIGRWMGITDDLIADALEHMPPLCMRLEVRQLGGADRPLTLINDAYNANPDSTRAALATLAQQAPPRADGRRVAILGDMFELGDAGPDAHRAVGSLLAAEHNVHLAIFIGERSMSAADALAGTWPPARIRAFPQWTDDLPQEVAQALRPGDIVLLKASRGMALERLIPAIEERFTNGC